MGAGEAKRQQRWHVLGKSVRGSAHVRSNLPNQDAIGWAPESAEGPPIILAVSDGHGSAKCFRSERGSRFAVETAIEVLAELLKTDTSNLTAVNRFADEYLPQNLERTWRSKVANDLEADPFTEVDWKKMPEADRGAAQDAVQANPSLAYGATILAVLVAETFILYVQLGDGDILCVNTVYETSRPFDADERLIANETTSLCQKDAWREVRVKFVPSVERPPSMILVSTDGYANSFRDEEAFLKVGGDILGIVRKEGRNNVKDTLEGWLNKASQLGSGDDISLGILKCAEEGEIDTVNERMTTVESTTGENRARLKELEDRVAQSETMKADARLVHDLDSKHDHLRQQIKLFIKRDVVRRRVSAIAGVVGIFAVGFATVMGWWAMREVRKLLVATASPTPMTTKRVAATRTPRETDAPTKTPLPVETPHNLAAAGPKPPDTEPKWEWFAGDTVTREHILEALKDLSGPPSGGAGTRPNCAVQRNAQEGAGGAPLPKPNSNIAVVSVEFGDPVYTLSHAGMRTLDAVADALQDPSIESACIRVEGHTDSSGTEEKNLQISKGRAASVVAYLIRKGVNKDRLIGVGRGEGYPIDSNDTPEGQRKNRGVRFSNLGSGG